MGYFRENIEKMHGYKPGEQPKLKRLVKLNTNENPYPHSPKVAEALANFAGDLRFYPDPFSVNALKAASEFTGYGEECLIAGNGSDDILTIVMRAFVGEGEKVAFPEPSYSLYPVLANIQGGDQVSVKLTDDFQLPEDVVEQLEGAKVFFVPNPNAPTGNLFCKATIEKVCEEFDGIVLIDEAYADFASENCLDLVAKYDNAIVSRTLSKSFSLAGARFGFAVAQPQIIEGLLKVKDSYNVNMLTQLAAEAALKDLDYMRASRDKVIATRTRIASELTERGMKVLDSATNFLFVNPQKISAETYFGKLREDGIIVRYFPGEQTGDYVRITIGTDEQMDELLKTTDAILAEVN